MHKAGQPRSVRIVAASIETKRCEPRDHAAVFSAWQWRQRFHGAVLCYSSVWRFYIFTQLLWFPKVSLILLRIITDCKSFLILYFLHIYCYSNCLCICRFVLLCALYVNICYASSPQTRLKATHDILFFYFFIISCFIYTGWPYQLQTAFHKGPDTLYININYKYNSYSKITN